MLRFASAFNASGLRGKVLRVGWGPEHRPQGRGLRACSPPCALADAAGFGPSRGSTWSATEGVGAPFFPNQWVSVYYTVGRIGNFRSASHLQAPKHPSRMQYLRHSKTTYKTFTVGLHITLTPRFPKKHREIVKIHSTSFSRVASAHLNLSLE